MEIRRLSLAEGARSARGIAIVIDVFRAFTCEPLLYHTGAARVLLEGDIDKCLARRGDALLVGERDEEPIPGFDLTNSPFQILERGEAMFGGRTVVHRTTSGVVGALTALEYCEEVLLASFVTARAAAAYVRSRHPDLVSIVAMGIRTRAPAVEDERCGDYLDHLLSGRPYDHVAAVAEILANETALKFLRGDKPYLPAQDPAICLQRDLFDFTLRAERRTDGVEAIRVPVG